MHDIFNMFLWCFVDGWVHSFEWFISEWESNLHTEWLPTLDESLQVEISLGEGNIGYVVCIEEYKIVSGDITLNRDDFAG